MTSDERDASRATAVPELARLVGEALEERAGEDSAAVRAARRYLAGLGNDVSGRRYPELIVAGWGLVTEPGGGLARAALRGFLDTRCRGCGCEVRPKTMACRPCRAAWRERVAA